MTLTPEVVLHAYASGVFPMSEGRNDPDIFWVDPRERGILPLNGFHISRSLARQMKKGGYTPAINQNFSGVILACADREDTWINADIEAVFTELHARGFAHSFEIWQDGALIGGTYGITLGSAFFGESMFSRATGGSKLALAHLVIIFRAQVSHSLIHSFSRLISQASVASKSVVRAIAHSSPKRFTHSRSVFCKLRARPLLRLAARHPNIITRMVQRTQRRR